MTQKWACLVLWTLAVSARAQDTNPNIPPVPNVAPIAKPGALECEFLGLSKTYMRSGETYFGTPIYFNTGIVKDLELRVAWNGYLQNDFIRYSWNSNAPDSGFGDTSVGLKWCPLRNAFFGTDVSLLYSHKFPSAKEGMGSGAADNTLGLFFNKSADRTWIEFRLFTLWQGRYRGTGGGTVRQPSATLVICHPITENWTWSFGGTLNAVGQTEMNPRMVTNAWFVSYQIAPRWNACTGVNFGLNRDAPIHSYFLGLSFGLGPFGKK